MKGTIAAEHIELGEWLVKRLPAHDEMGGRCAYHIRLTLPDGTANAVRLLGPGGCPPTSTATWVEFLGMLRTAFTVLRVWAEEHIEADERRHRREQGRFSKRRTK